MSDQTVNLYAEFSRHFPQDPGATLLVTDSGTSYSYGDAEAYSARVANFLIQQGLAAGVALLCRSKSPLRCCGSISEPCVPGWFFTH